VIFLAGPPLFDPNLWQVLWHAPGPMFLGKIYCKLAERALGFLGQSDTTHLDLLTCLTFPWLVHPKNIARVHDWLPSIQTECSTFFIWSIWAIRELLLSPVRAFGWHAPGSTCFFKKYCPSAWLASEHSDRVFYFLYLMYLGQPGPSAESGQSICMPCIRINCFL